MHQSVTQPLTPEEVFDIIHHPVSNPIDAAIALPDGPTTTVSVGGEVVEFWEVFSHPDNQIPNEEEQLAEKLVSGW